MASNYKAVEAELAAGTSDVVICAACPWDRLCVQPPPMTSAEVERAINKAKADEMAKNPDQMPIGTLMTAMVYGGRDTTGEMCPVFVRRLRADRHVSDSIRNSMRAYQPPEARDA